MWVPVAVWQPCELLYTCYVLTYSPSSGIDESSFRTSKEEYETSLAIADSSRCVNHFAPHCWHQPIDNWRTNRHAAMFGVRRCAGGPGHSDGSRGPIYQISYDSGVTSHRQPRQCRGAEAQNGKGGPKWPELCIKTVIRLCTGISQNHHPCLITLPFVANVCHCLTTYHNIIIKKIWLLIAEIVLSTDMAKQTIIYVKCCANWFICLTVYFFIYCVCLISVC